MEHIDSRIHKFIHTLAAAHFTDREAWDFFRVAAFGEAIGWTTLISGIVISRYLTHGSTTAVDIAGQIHGTIFLIYLAAVLAFSSSLRWSRKQTLIALLASIPPYGTLVFEKYIAYLRQREAHKSQRQIIVRAIIINKTKLLAIQPKDSGFWCLPGGTVTAHETAEPALLRILSAQTGVLPHISRLVYVLEYKHRGSQRLELFFSVHNNAAYQAIDSHRLLAASTDLDELEFVDIAQSLDIEPTFLQSEKVMQAARKTSGNPIFINLP
jgi:integral membrane protein